MLKWRELYEECYDCDKCNLAKKRNNMVFGEGNSKANLMFIGEAPGADEDKLGRPFVGRAGQLLEKGLTALNLNREKHYYICNICKCRPENNRVPTEQEAEACLPYLRNQVALVKPKIIVCLGATAMKYIIDKDWKITRDRGKWVEKKGIYLMATFHPAALFRDESKKVLFWSDLKGIKKKYEELCEEIK
ncbi:uracil DNA glycosylase superfamily protein [Clostridium acetireducens DSM 10703]|jgi:uracil-DNA glycosylase family 4|uniref:Type-4 uracil-DNA glycosylase n=1 Tax=Clostridium acetireducens DSM 10703 TaxID=1121290 RepID=A0A1E8EY98_9CLOT|nr:uracil-DNA glycosylase [Clostridium acetireducens]OFI05496.1 uracil DNA glycosylase superfamily protein [Clostridium acetireducens DSM 10703]